MNVAVWWWILLLSGYALALFGPSGRELTFVGWMICCAIMAHASLTKGEE